MYYANKDLLYYNFHSYCISLLHAISAICGTTINALF